MNAPEVVSSPTAGSTSNALVERAFAAQFPAWEKISPFDPVKLVAEGLVGSLVAVEHRQRRMLESALDAMPALFGFLPKPARLPVALFRVRSPERVTSTVSLEGRNLRLRTEEATLVLFPRAGTEVSPVLVTNVLRNGNSLRVQLTTRSALAELVLIFNPTKSVAAETRRLELCVEAAGAESATAKAFVVADSTDGFRTFGALKLRRRDGRPVVASAGAFTVTIETDRPIEGELTSDVVAMAYAERSEDLSVGCLNGEAWESRALPAALVGIPDSVELRFPDGRRRTLRRLPEEALRTLAETPTAFREGYLYDGVQHRLVLPAADELVGEWNGGVEVLLPEALLLPTNPGVPVDAEAQLGEASSVLESLEALTLLEPALARESGAAFLERFYATMRRVPERTQTGSDVRPNEWATALVTNVPSLRHAEVSVDGEQATAFLLASDPVSADAFRLDAGLVAQSKRALENELPLRIAATMRPFVAVPLTVNVTLALAVEDAKLAALDETRVTGAVEAAVREMLLPPPFGDTDAGSARTRDELGRLLVTKLQRGGVADGVAEARLVLRDGAGNFVDRWSRNVGECPMPTVVVTLDVRVAGGQR